MAKVSSIFETDEFKPLTQAWQVRTMELQARGAYYDGTVYRSLQAILGPLWKRLYKGIKPLFLPFARAVDVDAGLIPGGWALADDAPAAWRIGMEQLFRVSRWAMRGVLFVHYGAVHGVSCLKVVDDRSSMRVMLAPINPTRLMLTGNGPYADAPAQALYVERRQDVAWNNAAGGDPYEYAEVTTAEWVRTFVNGLPQGIGGREAAYANPLGVVPYVEVRHIEDGSQLGACTYQRAIEMLDEVNELASYLADIIKKHVEPQWALSGVEPTELEKSGDNAWFLPEGGKADALVANLDIEGVLNFVKAVRENVLDALPELSFTELRKRERVATATLEMQMLELTLKMLRARPNYDAGLAAAMKIAGLAGSQMGIPEVAALADDGLELDNGRRVLPLDTETALRIESLALTVEAQRQNLEMQKELLNGEPGAQRSVTEN